MFYINFAFLGIYFYIRKWYNEFTIFKPILDHYVKKGETMLIRNTTLSDIEEVMQIYASAREFMRKTGNANQWGNTHPARELIEADIENEVGYVVEENNEIIGVFFFKIGDDPTYKKIHGGDWIHDGEYGVIHRIAVKYRGRGIVDYVYDQCFKQIQNLKIDTHKDNIPMQKSLAKNGFKRCGIIYLESGDERIAYQKVE